MQQEQKQEQPQQPALEENLFKEKSYVLVADQPILCKEDEEKYIRRLTPEQAAHEFGIKGWTEFGALLGEGAPQLFINNDKKDFKGFEGINPILEQVKEISQHLVACKLINSSTGQPDPKLGRGVFTTKPIKKGQPIAIYTGVHSELQRRGETRTDYSFAYRAPTGADIIIDSEDYRGMAGIIQHKPPASPKSGTDTEVSLADYTFHSEETRKQISTANARYKIREIEGGVPLLIIEATEDIPAYTEIGYDYSMEYWAGREEIPLLFDKNGATVDPSHYKVEKPVVFITSSRPDCPKIMSFGKKTQKEIAELCFQQGIFPTRNPNDPMLKSALDKAKSKNAPLAVVDYGNLLKKKPNVKYQERHSEWVDFRSYMLDPLSYIEADEQNPVCSFATPAEKQPDQESREKNKKLSSSIPSSKDYKNASLHSLYKWCREGDSAAKKEAGERTRAHQAFNLYNEACDFATNKDYLSATRNWEEALKTYTSLKDEEWQAKCHLGLSSVYGNLNIKEIQRGIVHAKLALQLANKYPSLEPWVKEDAQKNLDTLERGKKTLASRTNEQTAPKPCPEEKLKSAATSTQTNTVKPPSKDNKKKKNIDPIGPKVQTPITLPVKSELSPDRTIKQTDSLKYFGTFGEKPRTNPQPKPPTTKKTTVQKTNPQENRAPSSSQA